jgi:hypothetical protein
VATGAATGATAFAPAGALVWGWASAVVAASNARLSAGFSLEFNIGFRCLIKFRIFEVLFAIFRLPRQFLKPGDTPGAMSDAQRAERHQNSKQIPACPACMGRFLQKIELYMKRIHICDIWKRVVRLGENRAAGAGLRFGHDAASAAVKTALVITGAFCCTPKCVFA